MSQKSGDDDTPHLYDAEDVKCEQYPELSTTEEEAFLPEVISGSNVRSKTCRPPSRL